jgi:hypothetical protein
MRAAKMGWEMTCLQAVACDPQSDPAGLREMVLKAQ